MSHIPEKACAEACRVLKRGGKFGFTVWAGPEQNPGAKIVNDAIEAYANLDVGLPEGPPKCLFGEREECRQVLERAGFDGASMSYETRTVEWHHPARRVTILKPERNAGVRTAGILAPAIAGDIEKAIRVAIESGIKQYARGNEFVYQWRPRSCRVEAVGLSMPGPPVGDPSRLGSRRMSLALPVGYRRERYTIAPPQLEPAPAVQPKQ